MMRDTKPHQPPLAGDAAALECLREECLDRLFAARVELSPGAVALVFAGQTLTYRELNRQANQLARHLVTLGVQAETPVAFCLERSLHPLVAILAILKAGGVYVPIDPAYPRDRMEFMLRDAGVPVLIVHAATISLVPPPSPEMTCVDLDRISLADEPSEDFPSPNAPDNAAYIIFTSGSTGQPKGVVVTHRNVARLFSATEPWFGFGETDVWTLFHSLAFDFSVWEIWGALLYGGRLVVVPYWVSRTPTDFYQLLLAEEVTVLNQTPSAFGQLIPIAADAPESPELKLRWVIFGGEALQLGMLAPWFARLGDERPCLVNMYGITETTVHVTWRPLKQADVTAKLGSVIGRPIPDLTLHLLDEQLQPVPAGVSGEMFVGGLGVARGYLNRPALNAERFLPDPFSTVPGARLYRSGDLACRSADGELVYLGRADQQVKIRGFRIELGEVENALHRHEDIQQAAVLARPGPDGVMELASWIVVRPGRELTLSHLRGELSQWLPEYMIPGSFTVVPHLPLNPNGKVDRRALEKLAGTQLDSGSRFMAPRTDTERRLCGIWQEILAVSPIGIHDNFFALGGHSLQAMRLAVTIEQQFGRKVSLAALFSAPTIAEFAALLETGRILSDLPFHHVMRGQGEGVPFFYIPGVGGYEFLPPAIAQAVGKTHRYFDGFQYPGLDGTEAVSTRVEDLAACLIPQLQKVWPDGPLYLCGFSFGGMVAYELARQLTALGREVLLVFVLDSTLVLPLQKRSAFQVLRLLGGKLAASGGTGSIRIITGLLFGKARFLARPRSQPAAEPQELTGPCNYVKSVLSQAHDAYRPQPYSGNVVLLKSKEGLFYGLRYAYEPLYGWDKVTRGNLEVIPLGADHMSFLLEPNVSDLAARIQACLKRDQPAGRPGLGRAPRHSQLAPSP